MAQSLLLSAGSEVQPTDDNERNMELPSTVIHRGSLVGVGIAVHLSRFDAIPTNNVLGRLTTIDQQG